VRRGKNVLFAACGLISLISSENGVSASNQDAVDSADSGFSNQAERPSSNKSGRTSGSQQQGSKWGSSTEERQPSAKGGGKVGSEVSDQKHTYQSISAKSGANTEQQKPSKEGSSTSQQSNKWGSVAADQRVSSSKGGSATSNADSALKCEWSSTPKIIETRCEGSKKKTCIGDVECTENGSVPFKAEASCKIGGKGGLESCDDASACANSDSGVGSATCEIKYYTPTDDQDVETRPSSKAGAMLR
jgi:hypothetical protein